MLIGLVIDQIIKKLNDKIEFIGLPFQDDK